MKTFSSGIETGRDEIFIGNTKEEVAKKVSAIFNNPQLLKTQYGLKEDSSFRLLHHIRDVKYLESKIQPVIYRPFNYQYIYYDNYLLRRPFYEVMRHLIAGRGNNIALIATRQFGGGKHFISLCTEQLIERASQPFAPYNVFPLYLYDDNGSIDSNRRPNLDDTIWRTIENWVKFGQAFKPLTANDQSGELGFDAEPEEPHFLSPKDIFDYIYGVLHSPAYRAKYKEFLKVDFPRIPYPPRNDSNRTVSILRPSSLFLCF